MTILQAIILSIIEGISEFLPISSTGHLILAAKLMQIPSTDFVTSFEIIIQLGAILAVAVLYREKFLTSYKAWKNIIIAFIPTAIIGFALYKLIKHFLLGNSSITLLALFFGGILLIILELIYKEKDHHTNTVEEIPSLTAFLIGVCQSVAVIPGVSRSAATIIGALFLGTKRKAAVEFSFLLAVPTMLAASALDIAKSNFSFSSNEILLLAIGFIGSFVVAMAAIKFFVDFIKHHTFIPFGVYRIVLSVLYFLIIIR